MLEFVYVSNWIRPPGFSWILSGSHLCFYATTGLVSCWAREARMRRQRQRERDEQQWNISYFFKWASYAIVLNARRRFLVEKSLLCVDCAVDLKANAPENDGRYVNWGVLPSLLLSLILIIIMSHTSGNVCVSSIFLTETECWSSSFLTRSTVFAIVRWAYMLYKLWQEENLGYFRDVHTMPGLVELN